MFRDLQSEGNAYGQVQDIGGKGGTQESMSDVGQAVYLKYYEIPTGAQGHCRARLNEIIQMAEKEMLRDTRAPLKFPVSCNHRLGPHILSYLPRFKCTGGELVTVYRKHNKLHCSFRYPAHCQGSAGSGYNHSRELGRFRKLGDAHQTAATPSRPQPGASLQGSDATWRSWGAHSPLVNLNTLTMER